MTNEIDPFNITSTYVVLGDNGNGTPISVSDYFFEDLENKFGDFKGKRLVSHFTFDRSWDTWEMHPVGEEFVCLSGQVDATGSAANRLMATSAEARTGSGLDDESDS